MLGQEPWKALAPHAVLVHMLANALFVAPWKVTHIHHSVMLTTLLSICLPRGHQEALIASKHG